MTQVHGHVVDVDEDVYGATLVAAVATTDTTLFVDDAGDFAEEGGYLLLSGQILEYTTYDDDLSTITLATGSPVAVASGEFVAALADGEGTRIVDWVANIQEDDGSEPFEATVPHGLIDKMGVGLRGLAGESVSVEISDDNSESYLSGTGPIGKTPVVDGSYLDETTVPEPVPATAPASSPAIEVWGMPNSIMIIAEPVASVTTLLTFQVSTDYNPATQVGTWTAFPDMPMRGTIYDAPALPSGEPFALDADGNPVTYWFRCVASNAAGSAPASAAVSGARNLSAVEIAAAKVIAQQVITALLQAKEVNVAGTVITLSETGGVVITRSDGKVRRLPANLDGAELLNAIATTLVVTDGLDLTGDSTIGGNVRLTAQIEDPTKAPNVTAYYHSVELDLPSGVADTWGLCRSSQSDGWVTVHVQNNGNAQLYRFNESGALVANGFVENAVEIGGIGLTGAGGNYYVSKKKSNGFWQVDEFNPSLVRVGTVVTAPNQNVRFGGVASGLGSSLYVVRESGGSGEVVRNPYLVSEVILVTAKSGLTDTTGLRVNGTFDEFHVQRRTADVLVYDSAGARVTAKEWPRPEGNQMRGMTHWSGDPQGAAFWTLNGTGTLRRIKPTGWDVASDWAYTWVDSDTHTTAVSQRKQFTPPRGATALVSCSAASQETAPGTHVANRIQVYGGNVGGTLFAQGSKLAVGVREAAYDNPTLSGSTAPANNWGTVTAPGAIYSTNGDSDGPYWKHQGNGAGRSGPFEWNSSGVLTRGMEGDTAGPAASVAAGASVDLTITFGHIYSAAPVFVCTSLFQWVPASVVSVSTTQAVIRFRNFHGSSSFSPSATWLAFGR